MYYSGLRFLDAECTYLRVLDEVNSTDALRIQRSRRQEASTEPSEAMSLSSNNYMTQEHVSEPQSVAQHHILQRSFNHTDPASSADSATSKRAAYPSPPSAEGNPFGEVEDAYRRGHDLFRSRLPYHHRAHREGWVVQAPSCPSNGRLLRHGPGLGLVLSSSCRPIRHHPARLRLSSRSLHLHLHPAPQRCP